MSIATTARPVNARSRFRAPATPPFRRAVRVVVLDDEPLFRDALARALRRERLIELTRATGRPTDLAAIVDRDRPTVVVADPGVFGGEIGGLLGAAGRVGARLLLLAGDVASGTAYRAVAGGVAGYLSKESSAEALCEAVLAVGRGETRLDRPAQTQLAGEIRLRARDRRPQLSPREQQILRLIAAGRSAPRAGEQLHISTATVKTHLLHLYEKLGVADRAAAVAEGMRHGLIE